MGEVSSVGKGFLLMSTLLNIIVVLVILLTLAVLGLGLEEVVAFNFIDEIRLYSTLSLPKGDFHPYGNGLACWSSG